MARSDEECAASDILQKIYHEIVPSDRHHQPSRPFDDEKIRHRLERFDLLHDLCRVYGVIGVGAIGGSGECEGVCGDTFWRK